MILGSGLGAFGASAITQNRKLQQNNNQLEEITKQAHAKDIQHQNEVKEYFVNELNKLRNQLETVSPKNQVDQQTLNDLRQHYQQTLIRVETALANRLAHLVNREQLVNFEHQLKDSLVSQLSGLKQQVESMFQSTQSSQIHPEILNQLNQLAPVQAETAVANRVNQIEKIIAVTAENSLSVNPQKAGLRTIIFYDIENFTKGYNNSKGNIDSVSIKDILNQIKELDSVGEILGQYAYADWSNKSVWKIRQQISELGIKPEQAMVFRFDNSKNENDKNGRDMQITVDAIDIIYQNPLIECVVIASGDSDFIPLAEKLRSRGKVVIGCAYVNSTSQKFRVLCHHFVDVLDLRNSNQTSEPNPPNRQLPPLSTKKTDQDKKVSETLSEDFLLLSPPPSSQESLLEFQQKLQSELGQEDVSDSNEAIQKILKILNAYFYQSPDAENWQREGLDPSSVEPLINLIVPNIRQIFLPLGLVRFYQYLRLACDGSEFCLAKNNNSRNSSNLVKLVLRSQVSAPFSIQPRPAIKPLHHPLTYHTILDTNFQDDNKGEQQQFKDQLPSSVVLKSVALCLLKIRPDNQELKILTQDIRSQSTQTITEPEIRRGIFTFCKIGIATQYIQQQPQVRYISLVSEVQSLQDIHQALDKAIRSKLAFVLALVGETIDETVLAKLLFDPD